MAHVELQNLRSLILSSSGGLIRPIYAQGPPGDPGPPGPGSAAWAASTAVTAGEVRQHTDGSWMRSNATRTTGSTLDATEEGFWTAVLSSPGTFEADALSASTDARVSTELADPTSVIGAAADSLFAPSYNHPTMAKLARGAENVVIAMLSDSTGQTQLDGTKRWPRLLAEAIAALFPAYRVTFHEWSEVANAYNGATYPDVTIQAGTGSAKVTAIANVSLTSNVATITVTTAGAYQPGDVVTVAGVGAPYDGTWTITGTPTPTSFTFARTNADLGVTFPSASTVSSPFTLHVYNGSISGSIGVGILGVGTTGSKRYGPMIGNLNCDLISAPTATTT